MPPKIKNFEKKASKAPTEEELFEEAIKLLQKGERALGEEAQKLLKRAFDKYTQILTMTPNSADAIFGLGQVLWNVALKETDPQKKRNFLETSITHFTRASELDPSEGRTFFNLGQSFSELGSMMADQNPTEAFAWYEKAAAAFENAYQLHQKEFNNEVVKEEDRNEIISDAIDTLISLSESCSEAASLTQNFDQSENLFRTSLAKLAQALELDNLNQEKTHPEIQLAAGSSITLRAEHHFKLTANVNHQLFEEAIFKFSEALMSEYVNPVQGLCDRGDTYVSYAILMVENFTKFGFVNDLPSGDNQENLIGFIMEKLEKSQRDYETALQLEPEYPSILAKLGDVFLLRWRVVPKEGELLKTASQYYVRSMNVPFKRNEDPDTLYSLAIVCALAGNFQVCREWLAKWKSKNLTPQEINEAINDPDFNSVKNEPWFNTLFSG